MNTDNSGANSQLGLIAEDDAVRLVAIIAEVAAAEGDHAVKKRLLLERLCDLIDATSWHWALNSFDAEGGARHAGMLHGGFTPEQSAQQSLSAHAPESNRLFGPTYARIFEERQPITVRLEDHPGYEEWEKTQAGEHARAAGIGTFVSSVCAVDGAASSSVTLFRPPGRPRFSERQRQMVHIIMRGVAWLHTLGWPEDSPVEKCTELPSSHMPLLSMLIKGYSRQEIAQTRSLSIHTVNTYTNRIFQHFTVHSQTELMRLFLHGDASH